MSHLNFSEHGCDSTLVAARGANNRPKAVGATRVNLDRILWGKPPYVRREGS